MTDVVSANETGACTDHTPHQTGPHWPLTQPRVLGMGATPAHSREETLLQASGKTWHIMATPICFTQIVITHQRDLDFLVSGQHKGLTFI